MECVAVCQPQESPALALDRSFVPKQIITNFFSDDDSLNTLSNDGQPVAQQAHEGKSNRVFDHPSHGSGALPSSEDRCTPRANKKLAITKLVNRPKIIIDGVDSLDTLSNDGQAVAQQTQKGEIDRLFDYRSQESGALPSSEDRCPPRDINILDSRDGNNALPCYACKNRQGSSAQNCDRIELDHVDLCTVVAVSTVSVTFQPTSGHRGDGGCPNDTSGNGKFIFSIFTPLYHFSKKIISVEKSN